MSGSFVVESSELGTVATRLGEVTEALDAAARAAGDLNAVAGTNSGFTSTAAALGCATAWLDEVRRLGENVEQARSAISESASAYERTDEGARASFAGSGA
jgi:Excreted virulence factor EspC, type VII ESX diderm